MFKILFLIVWSVVVANAQNLVSPDDYFEQWLSPPGLKPASHGSSLVELPNGEFLSCWYSGANELARDVQIYCSRWTPVERAWSEPFVVVREQERSRGSLFTNKTVGNTVLYLDNEGILWLFYNAIVIGGWSGSQIVYKTSSDLGRTWSERGEFLVRGFGNLVRNKPIWLDPQRFLLPAYHELYNKQGYAIEIVVSKGKIKSKKDYEIPGEDHLQPALAVLYPDNSTPQVFGYLRNGKKGALLAAQWDQFKKKWSKTFETNLQNPDSAADATDTHDGKKILVVYNDSTSIRTPLALAVSENGKDFRKIWEFESDPLGDYSYPTLLKTKDGNYFLTYTYMGRSAIKTIRFSQFWLEQRMLAREKGSRRRSEAIPNASEPKQASFKPTGSAKAGLMKLSTSFAWGDCPSEANCLKELNDSVQNFLRDNDPHSGKNEDLPQMAEDALEALKVYLQALIGESENEIVANNFTDLLSSDRSTSKANTCPTINELSRVTPQNRLFVNQARMAFSYIISSSGSKFTPSLASQHIQNFSQLANLADQFLYRMEANQSHCPQF